LTHLLPAHLLSIHLYKSSQCQDVSIQKQLTHCMV